MPRLGIGLPLVSSLQESPITLIEDLLWEDIDANSSISVNYQGTRTNSILYSQDATNAEAWAKAATSIDSTLYEAPDGSNTANAIKSNNTGSRNYKITQSSLTLTTGKTYTASVYIKKGTLGFARVKSNDSSTSFRADFNLTTGAVNNTTNTIRTQVDEMDNDWYRCSITFQATATTSSAYVEVFACAASGDSTPNVAVSGIVLIYVWGFQLEENSEPSPYIVTTNSSRTTTETFSDLSNIWDFDGVDLMPEEDPSDEGAWEVPANLVLNNEYEELGSEQLRNGTFDTDSEWSKGGTWSISNGTASIEESGAVVLAQTLTSNLTSGKTYEVVYTISGYSGSGIIKAQFAGGAIVSGQSRIENGTHTEYLTATASHTIVRLKALSNNGGFTGNIDNVSVKQVDPNNRWVSEADWTIEDGVAKGNGASGSSEELRQDGILTVGDTYEFTFTIKNYSSGSVELMNNGLGSLSSNGVHTGIGVAASTDLRFRGSSFNGSIDNVTIREYAIQPQDV